MSKQFTKKTPLWKGLIHLQTKHSFILCTRRATPFRQLAVHLREQRLKWIEWEPQWLCNAESEGGKGSYKQGLEMNTQILTSIRNTSQQYAAVAAAAASAVWACASVRVCVCVIIWWVAMWGNKSALSSWSGTKWLRKQAELWFYSLMFVNIYNRGFREHRLWRTGRFRGSLKTNRETEKDRQQRQTETVK